MVGLGCSTLWGAFGSGFTLWIDTASLCLPSRIKGWWVFHHYISTFLSGVMLTW